MFAVPGEAVPLTAPLFFLVGLVFGSFGNVIICRLPEHESICGRSRCPHCRRVLLAKDLVPVLSYVCLRGRCRFCRKPVSRLYPAVELASAGLAVAALFLAPSVLSAAVLAAALWLLLLIAVIDARLKGIPDILNGAFILCAGAYAALTGLPDGYALAIGTGFFALQWIVSRGQWIGSGDIILAVGLSTLLKRTELVLFMLVAAYIIGALAASALLCTGRMHRRDHIAFGPFLALATLLALLVGERATAFLFPLSV